MEIVNKEIVSFINRKQGLSSGDLGELQKEFYEKGLPIIDPETAKLMELLLNIHRPKEILELGLAVGFSSSLMAKALPESKITSVERWDMMIDRAVDTHKQLNITNVSIIEGDAVEVMKDMDSSIFYDFIFLDCGKGQYINLLPLCLAHLNNGGMLFVDDIFQTGRILENIEDIPRRQRTIHRRMNEFIDEVFSNPNLKANLLPIADGVIIAFKKTEME